MEVSNVDKVSSALGFLASKAAEAYPHEAVHLRYLRIEAEDALRELAGPAAPGAVVGLDRLDRRA